LREARVAEAAVSAGQTLGPLHGVPVAVKDLFDVAGTPTTGGSQFPMEPAARDCTVVAKLRAAGAILLGKLNLHEFAFGPEGSNPHHGSPWNPWSATTHRLPGGSSSGSGVAVSAGLTPMGMGSDTGGSIRIPAACCGTVGLKPTSGRVSRAGILPLAWSLDHAGPLTRTVADAAAILSVIAGHDPLDRSSSTLPVPDYVAGLTAAIRGLRIGIVRNYVEQADGEVQAAIRAAVRVLEEQGCAIHEVALSRERYSLATSFAILSTEALAYHEPRLRQHALRYATDVRRRLAAGGFLTATDYVKGQQARQLIREEIDSALQQADCLLAPTLPVAAPPLNAAEVRIGDRIEPTRLAMTMFTRLFNLSGHPAISVPCGFNGDGMPLALQVVGRAFDEATILRVARAYEDAAKWHQAHPPGKLEILLPAE
jgi:aspartyl-tRNA(Asn)/glutamyl-tRNA(Gln) amidotransferase subunit A